MQLIYASQPFGYDDLTLVGILASARRNNARDGITGALICRPDLFMQLLEGRRDVVTAAFSRIMRDERHVDVVNLVSSDIDEGCFRNGPCATTRHGAGCGARRRWPTARSAMRRCRRFAESSSDWRRSRPKHREHLCFDRSAGS